LGVTFKIPIIFGVKINKYTFAVNSHSFTVLNTSRTLKKLSYFEKFEYKYTPIMKNTSKEYDSVIATCRALFINK
jgi:hypothetical protein